MLHDIRVNADVCFDIIVKFAKSHDIKWHVYESHDIN